MKPQTPKRLPAIVYLSLPPRTTLPHTHARTHARTRQARTPDLPRTQRETARNVNC
ncbi:hypothetical protein BS50DRAFT_571907 [Corynespora cassiicola Philippines]|uniref:Uncharacterized protein n=1 Tax=Corynespora cassiicola Philippines TaxID=1448308 RepID=A0A2T2NUD6_CORCC|nr:hypothetical protein BS50DRAFT_571907 [Corynespora cassiicola Philippines]